jgi:tape measure domain-containing protein
MADRVIRIIVDTGDGAQELVRLEDNLEGVEKQQKKTQSSSRALGQAFRALVGVFAIREIAAAANQYQTLQNRIRLVTDSTAEYNDVQDELFNLAQRTRSSLDSTVELYARVARSTDSLGKSQAEVLRFTESINKSVQISGATAQEAAASTIQFAQGLAAGALRGDELRSVLEQNSRLAQVLADEFETDIGGLRKLGEAGELAGERVFQAVINAGPVLDAEFARTGATIDQTITKIGNLGTRLIGALDDGLGFSEGLSESFDIVVGDVDETIEAVQRFALAFRTAVEIATITVANFAETVPDRFGTVRNALAKFIAFTQDDTAAYLEIQKDQDEIDKRIAARQLQLADEIALLEDLGRARADAAAEGGADLDKPGEKKGGGDAGGLTAEQQKLIDQQNELVLGLQQQVAAQVIANESGREYAEVLAEIQIQALAAENGNKAFADAAIGLSDNLRLAKLEAEALAEAQAVIEADQARAAELFDETRTATEKYAIALAELQDLFDRGLIDDEVFERAKANLDELDKATDDFFRRARENSQDILAGFLESGLQDLDDFGRAFAQMLLQLTSQALAANIFDAILGTQNASGGSTGGLLNAIFGGRQFGGGVQGGQAVNTGEGGRFGSEVFVPNVGGTVMPINGNRGAGATMAPPQVNLTSINTLDPSEITGAFNEGAGDQVLLNRFTTKRTAFRRALGV